MSVEVQQKSEKVFLNPFRSNVPLYPNAFQYSAKTLESVKSLMLNVPKWSDTLQKSCSKCCKIFKVCLTILGHYIL